jgi:hypothetical protein
MPRLCAAIADRLTLGGNIIETGWPSSAIDRQFSAETARVSDFGPV